MINYLLRGARYRINRAYIDIGSRVHRAYNLFSVARHRFWFVDIPRTSSSSIRSELGKRFGKPYGKRNLIEKKYASEQFFEDHVPAREMRNLLGRLIWNNIFTFAMVRNPWDRIYSMYHLRKNRNTIPKEWSFRDYVLALEKASHDYSMYHLRKNRNTIPKEWGFYDYVLTLKEASPKTKFFRYHGFRYGASEYILGENGEIMVDFIAKYEHRSRDIKLIASRLNFATLGKLHIQDCSPKNRHYSEFFDPEMREIIRKLYAKDIELFGYEFEDKTQ